MVLAFKGRVHGLVRWAAQCSGQSLVEYSLLVAFAASMIIAIGLFVGGTDGLLQDIKVMFEAALE